MDFGYLFRLKSFCGGGCMKVNESHREMIQYISQTQKLVYDAGGIRT